MATRDLGQARQAFEAGDVRMSRIAHARPRVASAAGSGAACAGSEPGHESTDDAGRTCAVFGAFEGVAVATAVIAAARAVGLPPPTVLTLALAAVCGLAVAMFVRDYVRFRVYAEHYAHERKREKWELESYPEGEIKEMVELYEKLGVSHDDADVVIRTLSKYDKVFVDLMMDQELRLPRPNGTPFGNALNTLVSFLVFGVFTLVVYAGCAIGLSGTGLLDHPWLQHDILERVLPLTPASVAAWLTALWTTAAWAAIKLHMLQHRPHGWWAHFLVLVTCLTVAYIVSSVVVFVRVPLASAYEAWAPVIFKADAQL